MTRAHGSTLKLTYLSKFNKSCLSRIDINVMVILGRSVRCFVSLVNEAKPSIGQSFFVLCEWSTVEHSNELVATKGRQFFPFHRPAQYSCNLLSLFERPVAAVVDSYAQAQCRWRMVRPISLRPELKVPVVQRVCIILETSIFTFDGECTSRPAAEFFEGVVEEFVDRTQGSNRLEINAAIQ